MNAVRAWRPIGAALLATVLSLSSAASGSYPPVLGTAVVEDMMKPITSESYSIAVPPLPVENTGQAIEFHSGILSSDRASFIKSTVSYGCEIGQSRACFPPFVNRYVFYVSLINLTSTNRAQYPSSGIVVTPGSTYAVSIALSACSRTTALVLYSISNSTWSFSSQSACFAANIYRYVYAGMTEIHNATDCSQFPASNFLLQSKILVNNLPAANWTNVPLTPPIDCGLSVSTLANNVAVLWNG